MLTIKVAGLPSSLCQAVAEAAKIRGCQCWAPVWGWVTAKKVGSRPTAGHSITLMRWISRSNNAWKRALPLDILLCIPGSYRRGMTAAQHIVFLKLEDIVANYTEETFFGDRQ